jgi:hypothetical protein
VDFLNPRFEATPPSSLHLAGAVFGLLWLRGLRGHGRRQRRRRAKALHEFQEEAEDLPR